MTVHSLTTPGEPTAQRRIAGRWKLLAVLLVCASPVIASYFTYYVLRPEGRSNYGELMNPQRPAPDVAVLSASGSPVRLLAGRCARSMCTCSANYAKPLAVKKTA
jgi:hypothetical protein